ncbi:major facilitator superfamily domain-containing protein [Pestalotiopsis sp. NC0098]|nr:major facilitator superfamily domain-containing protein [Pestalotiopsis sp. NC0098]
MEEKNSTTAEIRADGLDAGQLARDGLTATDRYGTALITFDAKAEARLRLKIDLCVVPVVALIFLFSFIDRANIANARLAGLEKDLGMKNNDYNAVNSIFFVSYILFVVPLNLALKMLGPGWYLPVVTIAFGITSIGTAYVHNFSQLAGVRFLLGIFEAGIMPGISYYLSRWYRRAELTFRISMYVVMAPLAGAFGGLLASGILNVRGFGGIPDGSWRLIFIIEGFITVTIGVASLFLLTDRPETARWLSQAEKDLAVARVKSERIAVTQTLDRPDAKKLWSGLSNPVTIVTGLIMLLETVTVQGLTFFAPTIIRSIYPHATVTQQQLYTVPPYAAGAAGMVAVCLLSWRLDRRHVFMVGCALPVMVGYIMFLATGDAPTRYAALFIIAFTAFTPGALTYAQVSANVVSDSARSMSVATNMLFANFGSLIATWSFVASDAPYYHIGNGLNFATSSAWLILAVALHFWMRWDNKKKEGRDVDAELRSLDQKQIEDLDWKHPAFRWKP